MPRFALRRALYFFSIALLTEIAVGSLIYLSTPYELLKPLGLDGGVLWRLVALDFILSGTVLFSIDLLMYTAFKGKFDRFVVFFADGYSPRAGSVGYLLSRAHFATYGGLCVKDKLGRILVCNQGMLKPFGLKQRAVLGKTMAQCFPAAMAAEVRAVELRAIESRSPVMAEIVIPTVQGAQLVLRITAAAVFYDDEPGELAGVVVSTRDVAEIKLTEHAAFTSQSNYASLFDSVPLAIFLCRFLEPKDDSVDFCYVDHNSAAIPVIEQLRLQPHQSLLSQLPFLQRMPAVASTLSAIKFGGGSRRIFIEVESLGVHLECVYTGLGDGLFTVICTDRTALQESEAHVLRLSDSLREAQSTAQQQINATSDDFVHFIHASVDELQPCLERLREGGGGPESVRDQARQIQEVLEKVQMFAGADFVDPTPVLVDLGTLTAKVVTQIQQRYPALTVTLGSLPTLRTAELNVQIVLSTLLLSARSHSPEGAALTVKAETRLFDTLISVGPFRNSALPDESLADVPANEWQPLTWSSTSNLDFALARRLTSKMGGGLYVMKTQSGEVMVAFNPGVKKMKKEVNIPS